MSPQTQPHAVARVRRAYARIEATARPEVWIDLRPQAEVEEEARAIDTRLAAGEHLPSQASSSPRRATSTWRASPPRQAARPTHTTRRRTPRW